MARSTKDERGSGVSSTIRRVGLLTASTTLLMSEPAGAATAGVSYGVAFGPAVDAGLAAAVFIFVALVVVLRRRRGPQRG